MEFAATLIVALAVTGVWGVYCYMLGRGHGQDDLIQDFLENNIIFVDEDGIIHSAKATPLPPPKRRRKYRDAPTKAPKRSKDDNDNFPPPSAPAV